MALFHGSRLRELRKNKNISIAELSKLSDVSTGLISQIEREMVIPSVVSIWRLAQALDTNINYFFDEDDVDDKVIIRKNDHRTVILHSGSSYYKLLSPASPERLLDMTEITLKSGCAYEQNPLTHNGEECGYVLKGELVVLLGGKEYVLEEGDSIYFNSTVPHKYINHGDEDCISIWAMTPAFF